MCAPEGVYLSGAVSGSDMKPAEGILQRLEQRLTKAASSCDCKLGVVRQIGHAVNSRDLAMQEISHEE